VIKAFRMSLLFLSPSDFRGRMAVEKGCFLSSLGVCIELEHLALPFLEALKWVGGPLCYSYGLRVFFFFSLQPGGAVFSPCGVCPLPKSH